MNFNGSHGCNKCETIGKYSHESKTTVFTNINAKARTNESFRAKTNPQHHKGETPLTELPIDMVLGFPVGDELHLLHLGLMRKFLYGWRTGSFGMRTKWSYRNENEISAYLLSCNKHKPFEIHRQIRGLSELARWKGTELRTFMLYTSLTVLKKFLPPKYFKHYLLFYCSVVILGNEHHCKNLIDVADDMIKHFLNLFKSFYGICHFTSNLHNLSHLVEEVRIYGVLSNFNAYSFENKLQAVKRLVRSGKLPLNQIAKRILEDKFDEEYNYTEKKLLHDCPNVTLLKKVDFKCVEFDKFGAIYTVYRELKTNDFRLVNTMENQWVLTRTQDIICINYFVSYPDKECFFYGGKIKSKNIFFDIPLDSNVLLIYGAKKELSSSKLYRIEQIACKLFCMPYFGSYEDSETDEEFPIFDYVFVPLWHTLK